MPVVVWSLELSGEVTKSRYQCFTTLPSNPGGAAKPKQRVPVLSPDIQGKKSNSTSLSTNFY